MGNISSPVFGASTPATLLGRLESLRPDPLTKAADPARVKAFADANPEVLLQGKYFAAQPVPASFGSVNYWGVHAFGFVNAVGETQFGKWVFEPVGGVAGLSEDEAKARARTSCSTSCVSAPRMASWRSISILNWRSPVTG